tara:strand:- start:2393 stop:2494 length:102 start_codon:yes stop_codon:yes gene_type:complete
LSKGHYKEDADVLRAGMIFGLLGLALCGMVING